MSIIPASRLSSSDIELLGNNLRPGVSRARRRKRFVIAAVNRSLAGLDEKVAAFARFADVHRENAEIPFVVRQALGRHARFQERLAHRIHAFE